MSGVKLILIILDKFRVRPSSGTLSPNNNAIINVLIQKNQHTLPVNKDKFLVMCMPLPDESLTNEEISNIWKEVNASSPVEQHRLKCAMPVTTAIINNLEGISGELPLSYLSIYLFFVR